MDKIVIVGDKSYDKTADSVKGYQISFGDGRIVLIQHAENQSVGGAIATGYKWVRGHNIDTNKHLK